MSVRSLPPDHNNSHKSTTAAAVVSDLKVPRLLMAERRLSIQGVVQWFLFHAQNWKERRIRADYDGTIIQHQKRRASNLSHFMNVMAVALH